MTAPSQSRERSLLERLIHRIDAFFLSPRLRNSSASQLSSIRMSVLLALATGLLALVFMPTFVAIWPSNVAWIATGLSFVVLGLPFALRQRDSLRHLGHAVWAMALLCSAAAIAMSGGQAFGLLAFLPTLPLLGFLVARARGALTATLGSLAVGGLGTFLIFSGAEPSSSFGGSSPLSRYTIVLLCTLGSGFLSQLFESFWNRTATDVADRAQAELHTREVRNESLLEHASEGVMIVDRFAVVKFASPAAERLLDVAPGESMNYRLRDFTVHDDFIKLFPAWQKVVADPDGVVTTQLRTRPNLGRDPDVEGLVLDVVVSNQLANPAVEGMVLRMRDVTELTRAESNYQALLDHSMQGIAVECEGRIVYVNQTLAKLFRSTPEQITETGLAGRSRPVFSEDGDEVLERHTGDGPGMAEMRFEFGPDDDLWVRMRWAPVTWRGQPARQIAFADITLEREQTARQERENERLASAVEQRTRELEASQSRLRKQERMATVGTLAAGIAHQINNPIGSILTTADFAILTAGDADGEQIRSEALEDIRSQAIRCGKIVRSVLQFSRSEPTEKWLNDLTGVLRTAVDATSNHASEREASITLSIETEATTSVTLMTPIELEQVFVNLIQNAIEAQPRGARISVSSRATAEDRVEVILADDGPGVAEMDAPSVFDPFFTTRLRDGGTGLGLSVAHGIVVDHGGTMWLDASPPDEDSAYPGARFHVELPSEKADMSA
ncbi:MAG: hypothetical protein CL931_05725 [Deltaproteobacteria bacterium]|nr:hypothetical protein [Deltaproteobacteria bacterium]